MVVVNSREFRANQGKYLGMVAKGEGVILRSRGYGSFKITPLTEDDTLVSKEEFFAKLEKSRQQILEGKGHTFSSKEDLHAFLESL